MSTFVIPGYSTELPSPPSPLVDRQQSVPIAEKPNASSQSVQSHCEDSVDMARSEGQSPGEANQASLWNSSSPILTCSKLS